MDKMASQLNLLHSLEWKPVRQIMEKELPVAEPPQMLADLPLTERLQMQKGLPLAGRLHMLKERPLAERLQTLRACQAWRPLRHH